MEPPFKRVTPPQRSVRSRLPVGTSTLRPVDFALTTDGWYDAGVTKVSAREVFDQIFFALSTNSIPADQCLSGSQFCQLNAQVIEAIAYSISRP